MLRLVGWIVWGCISWIDSHFLLHLRRMFRVAGQKLAAKSKRRICRKWRAFVSETTERCHRWALRMESPEASDIRKTMGARLDENQSFAPDSVISVYEKLRVYLLTDKWTPCVQRFYFALGMLVLLLSTIYPCLLLAAHILPTTEQMRQFTNVLVSPISVFSLLGGVAVFVSVLRQIETGERCFLLVVLFLPTCIWFITAAQASEELGLDLFSFLLLAIFCLAGLTSALATLACILQWRLLRSVQAIASWAMTVSYSAYRQTMISRIAAWLLLLAPNKDGTTGWRSSLDIEFLQQVGDVERSGAEWRSIVLTIAGSILGILGITNLGQLISLAEPRYQEPMGPFFNAVTRLLSISLPVNPAVVTTCVFLLGIAWGGLLEIWLSEFPNQIIGLACVQVRHFLASTQGKAIRRFENYRTVATRNPESIPVGHHSRWNLIAKHPIGNDRWLCLIEGREWIAIYDKDEQRAVLDSET